MTSAINDLKVPDFGFLDQEDCEILRLARKLANEVYTKSDSVKLASILKSLVACIDLTTLSGDDTRAHVQALAEKAVNLFPQDLSVKCAAICVYPARIRDINDRMRQLNTWIPIASVAGGFPSGQYHLQTRLLEIEMAVADGAMEIDVVINRAAALEGRWRIVESELREMRSSCGNACMKVILSVGDLKTYANIYRASWLAILAGADFIKTSTGKEAVNATLPYSYVMLRAIHDYSNSSDLNNCSNGDGRLVGFKAAGGIKSTQQALEFAALSALVLLQVKEDANLTEDSVMADNLMKIMNPLRFRIGASSLLDDLLEQLMKCY